MSHTAAEHRAELVEQLVADILDLSERRRCHSDVMARINEALERAKSAKRRSDGISQAIADAVARVSECSLTTEPGRKGS